MSYYQGVSRAVVVATVLTSASVTGSLAQGVQQDGCQLSIFFPLNVATPTAAQSNSIVQFVNGAQTGIIAINGFASDIGATDANLVLSRARAQNVAAVVTSTGANVAAQGFGESGPGPSNQRTDVVRDDCAEEAILGPGLWIAPAGLLPLLLGETSTSTSSSTGTP